jgi:transcriptional regulator with XRE-family HTH domain
MPSETVGQRIVRLRTERGLTMRDLQCPGVSYGHLSRIERGLRQPSVETLRLLAPKLGVSVEHLETGFDGVVLRIPREAAISLRDIDLPPAVRADLAAQLA